MIAPVVLSVFTVLITAPSGPDEGCPSARQVTDAMLARFPASVLPADAAGLTQVKPDVLRATLDVASDGTVVRFSLVDAHGDTQLRRTLPTTGSGRSGTECLALADTLAVIVERYLGFISYESSDSSSASAPATSVTTVTAAPTTAIVPLSPRPRGALVMLGAGWHMANQGSSEVEGRLRAQVELTQSTMRIAGLLSVGVGQSIDSDQALAPYVAHLRRFPIRLGALLELPAGPGLLEPAAELGIDVFTASGQTNQADSNSGFQRSTAGVEAEAAVGYRLAVARSIFVRPEVAIGLSVLRYDVVVNSTQKPIFATPRAYASFGIYSGFVFR